jgi:SAM-dependent methyltransferase
MSAAQPPGGNQEFYERTARWFGNAGISAADLARAALIDRHAQGRSLEVLELGAGFGGAAAATADLGHRVTAIELSATRAAFARRQLWKQRTGTLEVIEADFLTLELPRDYDVVAYWSGFGVGGDDAQRALLLRIRRWIKPGGRAYVDIFDPRWWQDHAGQSAERGGLRQRLGFDAQRGHAVILYERERFSVAETIRCYDEAEIAALSAQCGLRLTRPEAGAGPAPCYLVELAPA